MMEGVNPAMLQAGCPGEEEGERAMPTMNLTVRDGAHNNSR